MKRTPENSAPMLENIAVQLGQGKKPLSFSKLPENIYTLVVFGRTIRDEYQQLITGQRAPDAKPSAIYIKDNCPTYVDSQLEPDERAKIIPRQGMVSFKPVVKLYPRFKEGDFGIETWEKIVADPDFKMAVHVSAAGASVLIKTRETKFPSPAEDIKEIAKSISSACEVSYNDYYQLIKCNLPLEARSQAVYDRIYGTAKDEVLSGIPYDSFFPHLILTQRLAMKYRLALYRSDAKYYRFERFTPLHAREIMTRYSWTLTRQALSEFPER